MRATRPATAARATTLADHSTAVFEHGDATQHDAGTSGSATTRARFTMILAVWTLACPASRLRTGPARATVATGGADQNPGGERGLPASHGGGSDRCDLTGRQPRHDYPSRNDPAATSRDASHDRAGSTMIPVATATTSRRHTAPSRRSAAGWIVSARWRRPRRLAGR